MSMALPWDKRFFGPRSDKGFEELCCALLSSLLRGKQTATYGVNGQAQYGIDILGAWGDDEYDCIQCKWYQKDPSPQKLMRWVMHFLDNRSNLLCIPSNAKIRKFIVIAAPAPGQATGLRNAIAEAITECRKHKIAFEYWNREQLEEKLRRKEAKHVLSQFWPGLEQPSNPLLPPNRKCKSNKETQRALIQQYIRFVRGQLAQQDLVQCVLKGHARPDSSDVLPVPLSSLSLWEYIEGQGEHAFFTQAHTGLSLPSSGLELEKLANVSEEDPEQPEEAQIPEQPDEQSSAEKLEGEVMSNKAVGVTTDSSQKPVPLLEWLTSGRRHLLSGESGIGKTRILHMLALAILEGENQDKFTQISKRQGFIPIILPFRYWSGRLSKREGRQRSLQVTITQYLEQYDNPDIKELISTAFDKKKVILLLDGIEEGKEQSVQEALGLLANWFEQTGSTVVATTKTRNFAEPLLQNWKKARIVPLTKIQQEQLANSAMRATTKDFFEQVDRHDLWAHTAIPLRLLCLLKLFLVEPPLSSESASRMFPHLLNLWLGDIAKVKAAEQSHGYLQTPCLRDFEVVRLVGYICNYWLTYSTLTKPILFQCIQEFFRIQEIRENTRELENSAFTMLTSTLGILTESVNQNYDIFHRDFAHAMAMEWLVVLRKPLR